MYCSHIGLFAGYGEDSLGDADQCRIRSCNVMEEGPYRSEARIARVNAIAPRALQVVQVRQNHLTIKILDSESARLLPRVFRGK
jgi:hypothetical protein